MNRNIIKYIIVSQLNNNNLYKLLLINSQSINSQLIDSNLIEIRKSNGVSFEELAEKGDLRSIHLKSLFCNNIMPFNIYYIHIPLSVIEIASKLNHLNIIKWYFQFFEDNAKKLKIMKYGFVNGNDINRELIQDVFENACSCAVIHSHLRIIKYLYQYYIRIVGDHILAEKIMKIALSYKHLHIIKWIHKEQLKKNYFNILNNKEKELYEAITTEKLSIVKWIYRNRYSQNYIFNGLIISHMLFGSNLQICKFVYKNVNFRCKNDKKSMLFCLNLADGNMSPKIKEWFQKIIDDLL